MQNLKIKFADVCRYLGCTEASVDLETSDEIKKAAEELQKKIVVKKVHKEFQIEEKGREIQLINTTLKLEGKSASELLRDSNRCILMAITLGEEVEFLLRRLQVLDMSKAVIMDACASSMIENCCDAYEEEIREAYRMQKVYFTDRFSPGYGDLKLNLQRSVCKLLETDKKIGVAATSDGIMIPRKSITAIIGIAKQPQKMRIKGCAYCDMKEYCDYRKRGKVCD